MATPAEKLANSLEALHALQKKGHIAIRSNELSRTDRERLRDAGFLAEVIKGWYIPANPGEQTGESTAWYAAYWPYCAQYLNARFDDEWSLSPEQSLLLHAGNWAVPRQLLVRAPNGRNKPDTFPHNTSIFAIRAELPDPGAATIVDGLRLFGIEAALIQATDVFFQTWPTEARTILAILPDASTLLAILLEGGHTRAAGRLAGAFRNIGRPRIANDIMSAMRSALHSVRETDPFEAPTLLKIQSHDRSPYVHRIRIMWHSMRTQIIGRLPPPPAINDLDTYLKQVDDIYVTDAYHSLSIEGYRVTPELIERVRSGNWNPDQNDKDREHKDALAARGYWQAFQAVKESVERTLNGANPGTVADEDHGDWYRELFAPNVTSGIIKASQLAGYRNGPVYIRKSLHVPLRQEAVRDTMPTFFELLSEETDPAVRVVLGHFVFVYIHPYFDGNGRMSRFLMNVMMAAGGYPWTVIRQEDRPAYMAALEAASVDGNIVPFAEFIATTMRNAESYD